jgi:uncharacterized repeat protein (TIGR04076 family)
VRATPLKLINLSEALTSGDVMEKNGRLKITVLKKTDSNQIFGSKPPTGGPIPACSILEEGQTFIVEQDAKMPEGFCHWAWNDINKKMLTLLFGGNLPWMKEKGTSISCCTDGFRPVIFELRRIQ